MVVIELTNSSKISDITNRDIFELDFSQSDQNYDKSVVVRFWQCLGLFNLLTVEGCSEPGLFRHLTKHVFRSS